jgi:hypothetical protein
MTYALWPDRALWEHVLSVHFCADLGGTPICAHKPQPSYAPLLNPGKFTAQIRAAAFEPLPNLPPSQPYL